MAFERIILMLAVLWVVVGAALADGVVPAPPSFDLQGHRGARGLHPENSLEGFREALALGVTTLELDIGLTQDGVVVVHHDERLNPATTRGPGGGWIATPTPALRHLTWSELAKYDVGRLRPGSEYAARFPLQRGRDGIRIPKLEDVLRDGGRFCDGRVHFNVETKLSPLAPGLTADPVAMADALVRVLRTARLGSRVMVQSFDWRTLKRIQKTWPELETGCLTTQSPSGGTVWRGKPGPSPWTAGLDVDDFGGSVPRLVKAAGCAVWAPLYVDLRASDVTHSHELGLRVIPWTVNEPESIDAVLDLGVDGIISDYPDRVRAAMKARGSELPASCSPTADAGASRNDFSHSNLPRS